MRSLPSRWTTLSSVMLALAVVLAGLPATVSAQSEASPRPSAGPSAPPADPSSSTEEASEPTPEPFPTFDPAGLTIRTELVSDGFTTPVYVTGDGTGSKCLYVVERGGIIRLLNNGLIRPAPYLDISRLVSEGAEQGLHSVAFHPKFKKNGRYYVHYNDAKGDTRIDEFRGQPCKGTSRPKPSKRVLTVDQPRINNNGGWIGFGPDGFLYIPLGDGGGVSPGDPDGLGQSKPTLLSKVLRIDIDRGRRYEIPKNNPYAKKRRGFPRETWARGLRDPRRASFDSKTGDLWIGDEGQDRFQEINRIPKGTSALNFGWSDMEGELCHNLVDCDPTRYELPVHTYDSTQPQCGVVGGYVYRGEVIPELEGVYLFSDRCSGFIWGLDAEAVAAGEPALAYQLLDAPQRFVSFGQGNDGELFLVALDGGVYRLEAEAEADADAEADG